MPHNFVIALAGPYGAGCSSVVEELSRSLNDRPKCKTEVIKVSSLIETWHERILGEPIKIDDPKPSQRRIALQKAGTALRKKELNLIGQGISHEIYLRGKQLEEDNKLDDIHALFFIIDCLKNRVELETLRDIYQDQFFFLFVHANRELRWRRAKDYKSWSDDERPNFEECDAIDKNEKAIDETVGKAGQQVQALAPFADYYISSNSNRDKLRSDANRFLELIFGDGKNQPNLNERTMHIAFSVSNRSFCLSRQVGAAIVDTHGDLLSVGHNDVPCAHGGLYNQEHSLDKRCFLVGDRRCINDTNKQERFQAVAQDLCKDLNIEDKEERVYSILKKSEFSEVTEYCRAVHAEMEAILALTRTSSASSRDATMCVTTQPCHNCTKHIISSGIAKVLYMEPYPKSLAEELHSDAVLFDPEAGKEEKGKIIFAQYHGVAPTRYHDFFEMRGKRKDGAGVFVHRSTEEQSQNPRLGGNDPNVSRTSKVNIGTMIQKESKAVIAFSIAAGITKNEVEEGEEDGKEE